MTRHSWLIIPAILGLSVTIFAADKAVDFSGSWTLDPTQTKVDETSPTIRQLDYDYGNINPNASKTNSPQAPPAISAEKSPDAITLQIHQTDGDIQVTRQFISFGKERTIHQKFKLDGSQCLNLASDGRGEFVSRSDVKNNKLIHSGSLTITTGLQRTEIYVKEEYSLSKNGKKLTIKTMTTGQQGVTTLKQVFLRKAE